MLCNNYQFHNLIGPYHLWEKGQRNSTLFTRQFNGPLVGVVRVTKSKQDSLKCSHGLLKLIELS